MTTISLYANGTEVSKPAAARALQAGGEAVTVLGLDGQKIIERIEVLPRCVNHGTGPESAKANWGGIGSAGAARARRHAGMTALAAGLIELAEMAAGES